MPIMNIGNVKFSKMDRKISILPSKENLIQPKADFTDKTKSRFYRQNLSTK